MHQPLGNVLGQDAPKPCHGRYRNLGGQEVSTPIPDGLSDVQGSYGVSQLTVRTSSALLLRILVDGKDFVDDAS